VLSKCILLDHPRLFYQLRRNKVPLLIGGRYGGFAYPCEVRGVLGKTAYEPFPAALGQLQSIKVWVPLEDGERTREISVPF
jgi:hypothetical protein